jgi:sterol desaturase/sphingolipid hydroxylase (fatty acid hydroxylase superfamily)
MHLPNPTEFATPILLLLVFVEMIFVKMSGRGHFEFRDTTTNLLIAFGGVLSGVSSAFVFAAFALALVPYRLADLGWSPLMFAVAFVLDDLAFYWWHRANHRVRWLWADHVQHHSSQHFNLTTALRRPITGVFTPGLLFNAPLILLGFPLAMIAFVRGINLVYQFCLHTEVVDRFPFWFEAVMNTPSHHRGHHASNARYLDSNYAGTLIIWDRLFGTFVAESVEDRPRYGLVKNVGTFNPIKIVLHEWAGLVRDVRSARSLREVAGYVFAPPGWSLDGSRETSESVKATWAQISSSHASVE